jgi:CheY-like chemotaxis protein
MRGIKASESSGFKGPTDSISNSAKLCMAATIVAITASVLEAEIDRCFASGMDDFLPKPLEMPKLRSMLKKWMPEPAAISRSPPMGETSDL